MLNVIRHQGNANSNHDEIPLQSHWNDYSKTDHSKRASVGENMEPQFSPTCDLAIPLLGVHPREIKILISIKTCTLVIIAFFMESSTLETTQTSTDSKWINHGLSSQWNLVSI